MIIQYELIGVSCVASRATLEDVDANKQQGHDN